jgi:hypothetical protein
LTSPVSVIPVRYASLLLPVRNFSAVSFTPVKHSKTVKAVITGVKDTGDVSSSGVVDSSAAPNYGIDL